MRDLLRVAAQGVPPNPDEVGFRPGDVILEVNRKPVRSARDFAKAVEESGDRDLVVLLHRDGSTVLVAIEQTG